MRPTLVLLLAVGAVAACEPSGDVSPLDPSLPGPALHLDRVGDVGVRKAAPPSLAPGEPGAERAALRIVDLATRARTADELARMLVGSMPVSNAAYAGQPEQAGTFHAGMPVLGLPRGVVLSSGHARNAMGPNAYDAVSGIFLGPFDGDLSGQLSRPAYDVSVLTFDVTPTVDRVEIDYVFGSEEYNEFVNTPWSDGVAFFINGVNCALLPDGQTVMVRNVNGGNPLGTAATNPHLFRNNDLDDGGGTINTEMDGLTTVLTCVAPMNPGVPNSVKLVIGDGADYARDSNVFIAPWRWPGADGDEGA